MQARLGNQLYRTVQLVVARVLLKAVVVERILTGVVSVVRNGECGSRTQQLHRRSG